MAVLHQIPPVSQIIYVPIEHPAEINGSVQAPFPTVCRLIGYREGIGIQSLSKEAQIGVLLEQHAEGGDFGVLIGLVEGDHHIPLLLLRFRDIDAVHLQAACSRGSFQKCHNVLRPVAGMQQFRREFEGIGPRFVACLGNAQGGRFSLTGKFDPGLAFHQGAVLPQQQGNARRFQRKLGIIKGCTHPGSISPNCFACELLTAEQAARVGDIVFLQVVDRLAHIRVRIDVAAGVRIAAHRAVDSVYLITAGKDIAERNAAQMPGCGPASQSAHLAAGGIDRHICPDMVCRGMGLRYHANNSAGLAALDLQRTGCIAVGDRRAGNITYQAAYTLHNCRTAHPDRCVPDVATIHDIAVHIAYQTAHPGRIGAVPVVNGNIRCRALLYFAVIDVAYQCTHIPHAGDLGLTHVHVNQLATAHIADKTSPGVGDRAACPDYKFFHRQILDNTGRRGQVIHYPGPCYVLQSDVTDNMTIAVQFAGESGGTGDVCFASVEDDGRRNKAGILEINIRSQPVVPVHVIINVRPLFGIAHGLPEFKAFGLVVGIAHHIGRTGGILHLCNGIA